MGVHFGQAGETASHHIEAVAHAGLAGGQTLAVRAVAHPQQAASALTAELNVVGCVDDLHAQVQRLEEDAAGQRGTGDERGEPTRGSAVRPQIPTGGADALGVRRRQARQIRLHQLLVNQGEKGVKEALRSFLQTELGAQDEETHICEKLPDGSRRGTGQITVRVQEDCVSVVLRLTHQGVHGFWKTDEKKKKIWETFQSKVMMFKLCFCFEWHEESFTISSGTFRNSPVLFIVDLQCLEMKNPPR